MTQNLSAGVSSPQSAPGAPGQTPHATTPHATTPSATTPSATTPPATTLPATTLPATTPQGKASQGKKPPARKSKSRRKPSRVSGRRPALGAGRAADVAPDARTTAERRVRIGSPAALLAVVPVLLGFEPGNSVVVIGTDGPGAQVRLTLRYDLPDPRLAAAVAAHAAGVLSAQRIRTAVAVGYGPEHLVSPVADALRECAPRAGITVTELLRAEGQRYWSYVCTEPACCPPEGTPFDVRDHPAARAMAAEGVGVLASRDELAATVAPVTGEAAERMRQATREAEERVATAVARVARSGRKASVRRLIAAVGLPAVSEAIGRYRGGGRLEPEEAAWLSVVLRDLRVRDDAWSRMRPEHREAHRRLWTEVTRLAQPGYVRAPASLLAFVAWQSGNGALANVALDRALEDDPRYSMAVLLRQVIDSGAPPSLARLPMTPDDVAASYDALEANDERDGEAGAEANGEPDGAGEEAGEEESGDGQDW
jgi:Domain of unknown function (DUF4192)